MFNRKPSDEELALDTAIMKLITKIENMDVNDENFANDNAAACQSLKTLSELRTSAKPPRLSADQIAVIAANLTGIAMILSFEKAHVLTTKSLSFVPKLTV